MIGFRWGAARAGAVGWFVAMGVAYFAFGAGPDMLIHSQTKGALLTIYVLYIVLGSIDPVFRHR